MPMENQSISRELIVCNLGLIDYKEAWDLQLKFHEKRRQNQISDILFLCEHPNTYTLGKVAEKHNLLYNEEQLAQKGINVFEIDRGGDITYHGPGQIVGYAIINLENWKKDTHLYLRALEETLIQTCKSFGIESGRNSAFTGVWIDNRKICAIGIKVSRWITMHGFAFNVNTELELFDGIIPCGIQDKKVTSLKAELNKTIDLLKTQKLIIEKFSNLFSYDNVYQKTINEINN